MCNWQEQPHKAPHSLSSPVPILFNSTRGHLSLLPMDISKPNSNLGYIPRKGCTLLDLFHINLHFYFFISIPTILVYINFTMFFLVSLIKAQVLWYIFSQFIKSRLLCSSPLSYKRLPLLKALGFPKVFLCLFSFICMYGIHLDTFYLNFLSKVPLPLFSMSNMWNS